MLKILVAGFYGLFVLVLTYKLALHIDFVSCAKAIGSDVMDSAWTIISLLQKFGQVIHTATCCFPGWLLFHSITFWHHLVVVVRRTTTYVQDIAEPLRLLMSETLLLTPVVVIGTFLTKLLLVAVLHMARDRRSGGRGGRRRWSHRQ